MVGFAAPGLLLAGLALPLLYLLLRLLPPSPRRVRLPSFKLLGPAEMPPPPSATPPWWLLLLRIGIAALLLLGLAGPRWQPPQTKTPPQRLAIVIDNGWAAASQWDRLVAAANDRINALGDATRFAIMPTAAMPGGDRAVRFVGAAAATAQVAALSPLSWPGDRAATARALPRGVPALWIADGLEDAAATSLRAVLRGGEVLAIPPSDPAFRIAGRTRNGWSAQLARDAGGAELPPLDVLDARGSRLHREPLEFEGDVATVRAALDPPARARAARLVAGRGSVQATYLADGGGERPRAVVVEGRSDAPPLESGGFYVRRALEPHADVAPLSLAAAANDPASFFVLVDVAANEAQAAPLLRKIERGAALVLFAGPRVAENGSAFAPIPLRTGARALGGVLSWQKPQALGGTASRTPLAGLPLRDATVSRQLLAASDAGAERWAWLVDGTPVVSAARRGAGIVILVHTAADPSWSTLPLTGVFEMMLRRLLPLGADPRATDIAAEKPWVLERLLGARGDWQDPPRQISIAAGAFDAADASAATPPGIYRSGDVRRALNLASALGPRFVFTPLSTSGLRPARTLAPPVDLGRWLLLAAALLAAFDAAVALRLRGAFAASALMLIAQPAQAADIELAYVRSGSAAIDAASARGLEVLAGVLTRRTSVEPGKPAAVDPARDPLGRYPVLYWPAASIRGMSPAAAGRLRDYLASGGLVLFDFGRPLGAGSGARELLAPLGLPALAEVGPDHVLSKTFYLLPGFGGGAVWAEAGTGGASGRVSGVVIGGGDWAALWSGDRTASPAARETALRFGVNLVMYALTGTYKADQVHTRALLERMDARRR